MRITFLTLVAVALLLFSSSATAVITQTGTLNTDGNEYGITVVITLILPLGIKDFM